MKTNNNKNYDENNANDDDNLDFDYKPKKKSIKLVIAEVILVMFALLGVALIIYGVSLMKL